jgi:5-formaminoimidazole-4-carboxamide-1-beta-D-ribofuranosyl 5'-monophosphate synthetase
MKEKPNPLKYRILEDNIDIQDKNIKEYVEGLKELISYQYHIIKEQRSEIIAIKHQDAWKRYDKT